MKIRRILLSAYGPFTDAVIDLPDDGTDFHLLFGPNEAGKSSALRALRRMLFGIPTQTGDNFLHGYASLRIGARLVDSSGNAIDFLRRKGRAKTLRGPDDETVLDDDALAPFLGGVSAEVFEQMFAIGHDDLIHGGKEIVSGQGSVGEALFSAGAGLIRLQNVQQQLEADSGGLFKPSGSTPSINRTIKAIREARQAQKAALLPPRTWKTHDRALRDAETRMATLRASLADGRQRRARLRRVAEALPLIARKKEIDAALETYREVPDLPEDFGDKRRDAQKELAVAARDVARSRDALETIEKALGDLPGHDVLIDHAGAVEGLQQDLGGFRKAQQDRPGLDGRMRTLRRQADDLLAEIGGDRAGDAAASLVLPPSAVSEVQELAKTYERLTARAESAAEQQRRHAVRFEQLAARRREMAEPADVSRLEAVLQTALEAGPAEKRLAEMRDAGAALEAALTRALGRQTLWNGAPDALDGLPLPAVETVDRYDRRFDALRQTLERQREAGAAAAAEIDEIRTEIRAIRLAGEVPTEADLKHAREVRDRGWGLIRQRLDGGTPPDAAVRELVDRFDGADDLPQAFERSLQRSDHVADRLRREADQVSRNGLLEARMAKLEKALAAAGRETDAVRRQQRELEAEWQGLWAPAGVTALPPREMRAWLAEIAALRGKQGEWRTLQRQTEILARELDALKSDLCAALAETGLPREPHHPLAELIRTARGHIRIHKERESNIAAADKELADLAVRRDADDQAMTSVESELAGWTSRWQRSLQALGIRTDATPTAALAVVERIREVKAKVDEAEVLQKRIDGIDRDADAFISRVGDLAATFAPDLAGEPPERAAERLNGRLTAARKDASRRLALEERRDAAAREREEAERRRFECEATIAALCREAGCAHVDGLAETERRARERRALTHERHTLTEQLRKLSAGETVDDFIQATASLNADAIAPELQELDDAVQAQETERSTLDQEIGALRAALEQMDGRSEAVRHAEQAERLLAVLESDVETYARFKIAGVILSRTVEQYRKKHQGPLIARASDLFACMTLGGFDRLRADYDDKGSPVLVGIRASGGAAVHVEGMSDGTADQLYLALRLASLEQYLEANEPLPFVVDDILLRFDDERALATLGVLAELARKTQVLFFTHHRHLVDLAEGSKNPPLKFHLHRL